MLTASTCRDTALALRAASAPTAAAATVAAPIRKHDTFIVAGYLSRLREVNL